MYKAIMTKKGSTKDCYFPYYQGLMLGVAIKSSSLSIYITLIAILLLSYATVDLYLFYDGASNMPLSILAGFFNEKIRLIDWRWSVWRAGGRRPQLS